MTYESDTKNAYRNKAKANAYKNQYIQGIKWARFTMWRQKKIVAKYLNVCNLDHSDSLLDIPCGAGYIGEILSKYPCSVVASDISIEMMELARSLGDELVVIVNNDVQAKIKKGKAFMREEDRLKIVKSIKHVSAALLSIDENKTVCKSLKKIKKAYPKDKLIFANGGDRTNDEAPESKVCEKLGIKVVDGLGKKIRSSSDLTGIK